MLRSRPPTWQGSTMSCSTDAMPLSPGCLLTLASSTCLSHVQEISSPPWLRTETARLLASASQPFASSSSRTRPCLPTTCTVLPGCVKRALAAPLSSAATEGRGAPWIAPHWAQTRPTPSLLRRSSPKPRATSPKRSRLWPEKKMSHLSDLVRLSGSLPLFALLLFVLQHCFTKSSGTKEASIRRNAEYWPKAYRPNTS